MINVLIVSEKTLTRIGLSYSIFWEMFGYTVIDSVATWQEAKYKIKGEKPELVFIELPLSDSSTTDVLRLLNESNTKTVIITDEASLATGLIGSPYPVLDYIPKNAFQPEDLIKRLLHYSETAFADLNVSPAVSSLDHDIILAARQQVLKELLYGWKKHEQLNAKTLERYEIHFPNKEFIIILLKLDISFGIDLNTVDLFFENKFINENVHHCKNDLNEIVFICNVDDPKHNQLATYIAAFSNHINHIMTSHFDVDYTLYTSKKYFGLNTISKGYLDCSNQAKPEQAEPTTSDTDNVYIRKIKQFIISHYDEDITAKDLAYEIGLTTSYFSTFFKNATGQTYKNFLIEFRLLKATELLENTTLHVAEIAKQVGYDNENYFSKLFKSKLGISPTNYRRNPFKHSLLDGVHSNIIEKVIKD